MESGNEQLLLSGANHDLWLLRNGEIIEYDGTKRPIGKSHTNTGFEEHKLTIHPKDKLILFTDGITDQFGGPSGKKFKKSGLRSALFESKEHDPEATAIHLSRALMDWMGEQEQIDDMTIWIVQPYGPVEQNS